MANKGTGIRGFRSLFRYRVDAGVRQKELDRLAPKAGDPAPDFTLQDAAGAHTVTLSQFQGNKPVALVLGSFT